MSAHRILRELRQYFINYDYKLCNCYIFEWESDFFCVSKSGYAIEIEVKISKSDFKKDFTHKTEKHNLFKKCRYAIYARPVQDGRVFKDYGFKHGDIWVTPEYCQVQFVEPIKKLPNKFYYCVPENMIGPLDVPVYAGLMYALFNDDGHIISLREVKKAPFIHKNVNDFTVNLLKKYYWRHINNHTTLIDLKYRLREHLTPDGIEIINRFIAGIDEK